MTHEDLPKLIELLVEVSGQWELFLYQLNISISPIESIRLQYATVSNYPKLCLIAGLEYWVNSSDKPTYEELFRVLRGRVISNLPLARRLEDFVRRKRGITNIIIYLFSFLI